MEHHSFPGGHPGGPLPVHPQPHGRIQQPAPSGPQQHRQQGQGQQPQQPSQTSTPSPAPVMQGPPQLPPQLFTTAAQLLDLTDSMNVSVYLARVL